MDFEQHFQFAGLSRLNLGWTSPTFSGAFMAMLLPIMWWGGGMLKSRTAPVLYRLLVVALEASVWLLLIETGSRGAWVGSICGAVLWHSVAARQSALPQLVVRLFIFLMSLLATGYVARIKPSYVSGDGSVLNRFCVWRQAMVMSTGSIMAGWGGGSSGTVLSNWFQSFDRSERYDNMLSSYLTFQVEYGGLAAFVIFFVILWLPLSAFAIGQKERSCIDVSDRRVEMNLSFTAGTILIVWVVVSAFSYLWGNPLLWVLPVASAILVFLKLATSLSQFCFWPVFTAVLGSGSVVIGVLICGQVICYGEPVRIVATSDGALLTRNDTPSSDEWHIWCDAVTLGDRPGKEVRRWVSELHISGRVWVHEFGRSLTTAPKPTAHLHLVYLGEQARRLELLSPEFSGEVVLINPLGVTPRFNRALGGRATVILSEIDEHGQNGRWVLWARRWGVKVLMASGVGQDIRSDWPDVWRLLEVNILARGRTP